MAAAGETRRLTAGERERDRRVPWALLAVAGEIVARGDAAVDEIAATERALHDLIRLFGDS